MNSLLILITVSIMSGVSSISVFCWWIAKELRWLRAVLVPWMVSIHKEIEG